MHDHGGISKQPSRPCGNANAAALDPYRSQCGLWHPSPLMFPRIGTSVHRRIGVWRSRGPKPRYASSTPSKQGIECSVGCCEESCSHIHPNKLAPLLVFDLSRASLLCPHCRQFQSVTVAGLLLGLKFSVQESPEVRMESHRSASQEDVSTIRGTLFQLTATSFLSNIVIVSAPVMEEASEPDADGDTLSSDGEGISDSEYVWVSSRPGTPSQSTVEMSPSYSRPTGIVITRSFGVELPDVSTISL